MYVAYSCEECSAAPLTQYPHNELYQELPTEAKYFEEMDERLYIDIRWSKGCADELEKLTRNDSDVTLTVKLKAAATKKMSSILVYYIQ